MFDSSITSKAFSAPSPELQRQRNVTDPSFPFLIKIGDLSAIDKAPLTRLFAYENGLNDFIRDCITLDKNVLIDFKIEEKIKTFLLLGGIEPNQIPEEKQQAIKELVKNKILFFNEVTRHIGEDIDELGRKFSFHKEDVEGISLSFPEADEHHGGKSPVFLKIFLKDDSTVRLVYKPRGMELEALTCDSEIGLLAKISKDPRLEDISLPTYNVLAIPGKTRGYSEFVHGRLVAEEEFFKELQFGDVGEAFLRVNPYSIGDVRDYINILTFAGESYNSKIVRKLIDTPKRLTSRRFCQKAKIQSFLEKVANLRPPLNDPKTTLGLLKNFQQLYELNYFYSRTPEQLSNDHLLFTALSQIKLVDTHASNFICGSRDRLIVPIDLECFDDLSIMNTAHIIPLITLAFSHKEIPYPQDLQDNFLKVLSDYLPEFEKIKEQTPQRLIPLPTTDFYDMLWHNTLGRVEDLQAIKEKLILSLESEQYIIFENELEKQLNFCMERFEIPYFLLANGQLTVNDTKVAEKKASGEKLL